MSKRIFKYSLSPEDNKVIMPGGAQILCIHAQKDLPCVWAIVDTDADDQLRNFRIFGTGHELPDGINDMYYHGTFFMNNKTYVFHVFEEAV